MTNAEKIDAVMILMADGMSERGACEQVGIARATFRTTALRQLSGDQYAKALAALADNQVELLEQAIADMRDGTIDAAMARVEIDARKWFASKFLPKQFGDKLALGGADDLPALKQTIDVSGFSAATLAELAAHKLPGEA